MHPTDRAILEHCANEFQPVVPLKGRIPSGSLYRHVNRLVRLAWLEKQGALYRATDAGRRQLVGATGGETWGALVKLYPPLGLVPTPVHRALIELILAATVARQHESRPDRHPSFVAFGSTLRWKTSLGRFVCHALGLDPAVQVVDCGSEAGKSLSFRRGADGTLVSKRTLLKTPFVVLDEFQAADRDVRSTLGLFLGGRLVMPLENEQLTVRPVPLLTLNPKDAPTLEGRLGLSTPLIRRALLVNLDAMPMPDLATGGERAIEAARQHPPLQLAAPGASMTAFHDTIVALVRSVLCAEAYERVDVEIVVNLCEGMTAFVPELRHAIAQVVHDIGVLADTLQWARPGWIEVVTGFRQGATRPADTAALAQIRPAEPSTATALVAPSTPPTALTLAVPPPPRRQATVPELELSPEVRARLIWFAMETQQNLENALTTLLDFYLECRDAGRTMETLVAALRLAEQLEVAEIEVDTVHEYLTMRDQLEQSRCSFKDVPEALRLIATISNLPFDWDWKQAETAMEAVAAILEADIQLQDVTEWVGQHRQLTALGFDTATAVSVAEALERSGTTGDRREEVLDALVAVAGRQVDLDVLEAQRQELEAAIPQLNARRRRIESALDRRNKACASIQDEIFALQKTRTSLTAECERKAGGLAVVDALHAFLRTSEAGMLLTVVKGLLAWERLGRADESAGQLFVQYGRKEILAFLRRLFDELAGRGDHGTASESRG